MADLEELERLARALAGDPWYILDQPWLDPDLNPAILAGNPDPHVGRMILDTIDPMDVDEGQEEAAYEEAWAVAAYVVAAQPSTILALLEERKRLREAAAALLHSDGGRGSAYFDSSEYNRARADLQAALEGEKL